MIRVKEGVDILDMLSKCAYTSYALRKEKIFSQSSIQRLRKGGLPSWKELDFICSVSAHDISEIVEYVPDKEDYSL